VYSSFVKIGLKLANISHLPLVEGVGRLAVVAENSGFDSVWVADHVVIPQEFSLDEEHKRGGAVATKQHADPFISLAYVAGITSRVELGTAVMVLPLRNPVVTAKMISTLDVLSGGRVVIAAGVGWLEAEFEALDTPPYAKRGAVADEWIRIFRACWNDPSPSFEGEHYRFKPLNFSPKPLRQVPILIGGNSLPALRRAGRLGDGWHGTRAALNEIPKAIQVVKDSAETAGRDPSKLSFGLGVEIDIIDRGATSSATGLYSPDAALVGTAEEISDKIATIEEAGIQHLELRFRPFRDFANTTLNPALEMIEQFVTEIMPRFKPAQQHTRSR
jgi:probable F420-dependent oxidoreductase